MTPFCTSARRAACPGYSGDCSATRNEPVIPDVVQQTTHTMEVRRGWCFQQDGDLLADNGLVVRPDLRSRGTLTTTNSGVRPCIASSREE